MNTKGMKFLAVLAVLAMAFAAFAVVAPAETDDAEVSDSKWDAEHKVLTDTGSNVKTYGGSIESGNAYYISSNATITFPTITGDSPAVLLLIEKGVKVDIKVDAVPGAAMYISALSVEKSVNSASKNVYTSPVAVGTAFYYGTDLKLDTAFSEDPAVVGDSFGFGTEDVVGTVATFYALESGIAQQVNGGWWRIASATATFTGENTTEIRNYYSGSDSTWTFVTFTGTIATDTAGEVNTMVLTKFTGQMTIDSDGTKKATVSKWTSGDIEVTVSPAAAVILAYDIPTGSTLYVDADTVVTTDATIAHETYTPARADDTFYNDGSISIKKTKDSGEITTYGTFTLGSKMINNGNITNLGTFTHTGKVLTNNGKITTGYDSVEVANKKAIWNTNAAGSITNNGTFTFKETTVSASTVFFDKSSTGDVRNQTANNKDVAGVISNDEYGVNQSATIIGNTTLNGVLTLKGVLIIDEGVTLTIVDGGQIVMGTNQSMIINNGTISVQKAGANAANATIKATAGSIVNNGTVTLVDPSSAGDKYTMAIGASEASTATFLKNYGTFTNEHGVMLIDNYGSLYNLAGGIFATSGVLNLGSNDAATTVLNEGSMKFDGKVNLAAAQNIKMEKKGASVEILSLALPNASSLTILNSVDEVVLGKTVGTSTNVNIISGLKIDTYNVPNETTGRANYGYYIISGNVSLYGPTYGQPAAGDTYTIALGGVSAAEQVFIGDLTVQENVKLAGTHDDEFVFVGDALFIDSGSATITKVSEATVKGIVITNMAQLAVKKESEVAGTINAAMYQVVSSNYTKTYFYTTFENAIEDAADRGLAEVTVTGKITIEDDVAIPAPIKVKNQGEITIKSGADVVINDGAQINNGGDIKVNGSLYAAVASTGLTGNTTAAKIVSDVKVVGDPDVLYTNLYDALEAAEAGDTVVITKDGNVYLTKNTTIKEGVILDTNEKSLYTYKEGAATTEYKLTVDGTLILYAASDFKNYKNITLNGFIVSDDKRTYSTTEIPGAYFEDEIANVDYYYIAGVKNLGTIVASGIKTVDVWGDVSATTLEFAAIGTKATVTFHDDVEVTTITAGNSVIVFAAGDVVKATITDGEDSAVLAGVVSDSKSLTFTIGDDFEVKGYFEAGSVGTDKFAFTLAGAVDIGDLNVYSLKVTGIADIKGKAVVTSVIVSGSLGIEDDGSLEAKYANVTGHIIALGSAAIDNVTIGSSTKAIADAATVVGDVTAVAVILYAGNIVDEEIVADMKSTEFYVDGVLWFTAYSNGAVTLASTAVPVTDAVAVAKAYDDLTVGADGKISGTFNPGDKAKYDLSVRYDIYRVEIKSDAGIKEISINGKIMKSPAAGQNVFWLNKLEAGTYTVKYTLIDGYEGTATLNTIDGTILKDNKFALNGTDKDQKQVIDGVTYYVFEFQLSGTEPAVAPEPITPEEKSEWTITTILLVILVILIAVMAVIVALRLNRS